MRRGDHLLRFLERDRTLAHAAIQYVLAHEAVTCAIPGAKSPEQAWTNASAADACLSHDEVSRVREVA